MLTKIYRTDWRVGDRDEDKNGRWQQPVLQGDAREEQRVKSQGISVLVGI